MLIVGLTGSLGMGKSTAAEYLRARGIPVFDADAEVHRLYAGVAAAPVEAAFPGTTVGGIVDRAKLSAALLAAPNRFTELEAIVHPLVRDCERAFLAEQADIGIPVVVLEIPLLFETNADAKVDATIVVSAPEEEQRRRLAKRGLPSEKIEQLLARQMADADKRARADFVVETGGDLESSRAQLDVILQQLAHRRAEAYERHWC
jgi:dephospho-CoA kinase